MRAPIALRVDIKGLSHLLSQLVATPPHRVRCIELQARKVGHMGDPGRFLSTTVQVAGRLLRSSS